MPAWDTEQVPEQPGLHKKQKFQNEKQGKFTTLLRYKENARAVPSIGE